MTIVISVPSGAHHRSLLQPLRGMFLEKRDWRFVVLTPGAPWADRLFPPSDYPRDRFAFENIETEKADAPETRARLAKTYAAHRPRLVLTTTTGLDPLDRPILSVARGMGIPTCTYVESWDNIWKIVRNRERHVLPDHFIVWNNIMKRHLLRAFPDLTPDRVSVTGAARLDAFRHRERIPTRDTLFRVLGLDPTKRLLHLATTELYDMSHVARDIGEAKRRGELPADLQLYASMHPGSGTPRRHSAWAARYGYTLRSAVGRHEDAPHPDFRFNPTEEDVSLSIALWEQADVLVNFSSTAAIESMYADRPTICAFYGKPFDRWNWRRSAVVRDFHEHYADLVRGGGVRVARNRRELIGAITDSLEHPEKDREGRKRSCERILTTLKGDASRKTFDVIRTLVDKDGTPHTPRSFFHSSDEEPSHEDRTGDA